jgi:hypothetical protein
VLVEWWVVSGGSGGGDRASGGSCCLVLLKKRSKKETHLKKPLNEVDGSWRHMLELLPRKPVGAN